MNWALVIDPDLWRRMQLWGRVYPALLPAVMDHLENQLCVDPAAHLYQTIVPSLHPWYTILFAGEEALPGIPDGLRCDFVVEINDEAHSLALLDGRMTTPHGRYTRRGPA